MKVKHLYRVRFRFHTEGLKFLIDAFLNVATDRKGLDYAGPVVTKLMKRPDFRKLYPDAIVRDISYQGTVEV